MSTFQVSFFGATDIGRVRTNNEDTFIAQYIWDDRHILLAAIDGMGGEEGGEIAADIAKKSIIKYLCDFQNDTVLNLIKCALADANNEIIRHKAVQPQYRRMGCVATAGIIDLDEETLSIAHVGDSRLYRFSDGDLSKLTHDHSLVGYQEEQGILTEEQAMKHPRRSVIERCLGSENHLADDKSFIEAGVFPLIKGEKFLFCSDGLCDVLTSAQISESMKNDSSPEDECVKLIEWTNEAGGKDNITVVIAHIIESEQVEEANNIDEENKKEAANEVPSQTVIIEDKHKRKWLYIMFILLVVCIIGVFWGINYSNKNRHIDKGLETTSQSESKVSGFPDNSAIGTAIKDSTEAKIELDNHE